MVVLRREVVYVSEVHGIYIAHSKRFQSTHREYREKLCNIATCNVVSEGGNYGVTMMKRGSFCFDF